MRRTLVGASTAVVALALLAAPAQADGPPHLSEIHYDDDGADEGEAIEVAADPGADLTGWSVVLYNGSNGTSYGTLPLGVANADGFFVAAAVGMQNGAADGLALVQADATVVEFLSYEGVLTAANGPAAGRTSTDIGVAEAGTETGQSLQLVEGAWTGPLASTFGAANEVIEEPPPPPPTGVCGDAATLVHQIQGAGTTFDPAFSGRQTVEGVVSAVKPGLNGFYLQEEADDADADPLTSEGIFVYTGTSAPATVTVGQTVRLAGTVAEFGTQGSVTQLTDPVIGTCDVAAATIAPTAVSFPLEAVGDMERYEGMLVTFEQDLVISEYFNYARFGEVVAAVPPNGWDRLYTPTAVVEPGAEAIALADVYARSRITIDDSSTASNPAVLLHPGNGQPFSLENRFRGGDTITGITGVIDQSFNLYRVHPTAYGEYTVENPRPESAPEVGGELQVASFNVLNYFLSLTSDGDVCGPDANQECRGADDAEERERQRAKILAAIAELDADVVGLMEMENTVGVEPAADLVAGLNEMMGAGTYDYVDTGVVGTDVIRLGMLYKPAVVTPAGAYDVLDSTDDPRFVDTANRPMVTQTFDTVEGARFTVSVNHLKSKGSACAGDADTGDGQGNCNLTRTAAAEAIVDHLAADPTGSGDEDHLIIGDLNSYDHEDPIDALVAGGYVDQIKRFGGEYAYGYVFDGQAGYLDHALANETLSGQVTGAEEWNINADEASVLDYDTSFKPDAVAAIYAPDAYRSSDHDAVLVGLDLTVPPAPETTCLGLVITIHGGNGDDVIRGSNGRDVIFGGYGNDTIVGLGGGDVICGGAGDDVIRGGNGADTVSGGLGDDTLFGENGADVLSGNGGDDVLRGGNGADELYGNTGDDRLVGEAGRDLLDGGPGDDVIVQ